MNVYRDLAELPHGLGPAIVTIGNFDGVHCGHRSVLKTVTERARALRLRSVAVTFSPHPSQVLQPERQLRLLTPDPVRLELLARTGLDATLVLPFTREFSTYTAAEFAEIFLRNGLRAAEVHEGENFHFGRGAEGNLASLTRMGFTTMAYAPVIRGGEPISSSRIRHLVGKGNMAHARQLLGYPFFVQSETARGRGIGTTQTVPTLNLAEYGGLLPGNGVYVTEVELGGNEYFPAVTNIGVRPTFGAPSFSVETHALDRLLPAVPEGTPLTLTFLKRLREEKQWDSPEALRAQIMRDIARARRYFALREINSNRVGQATKDRVVQTIA